MGNDRPSGGFAGGLNVGAGESYHRAGGRQVLGEADRRLAATLADLADGFVILDREWRYTYVNAAAARMLNKSPEELLGQVVWDLFPEATTLPVYQHFRRAVEENVAIQFDQYSPGKGWFENRCQPTGDGLAVYFSNISRRKQEEEALRRSQERLQLACAAAKVGMWDWDPQTGRAVWSPEHYRIFGVDERNFVPTTESINQLVHPEDRAGFWKRARRDWGDGRFYENEFRIIRPDGQVRWLRSIGRAQPEREGKPVRMMGVVMDVTERKRAEEALRRSEAWLARGVEVSGLGLFDHDQEQEVIEWSAELREMLGLEASGPVTLGQFLERVPEEDRQGLVETIRRAHDPAGDGRFEVEYRVRDQSGRVRWMSVRSQTYFEGEGAGRHPVRTIGAVLDVTERKEIQTELERLVAERTAKLRELVGELEHFSYTITHDMRAPLRAMMGFAEMARRWCGEGVRQEAKEALARIETSAERMDALITDALNYGKAVRQELALMAVDADALLCGMLDTYPEFQPAKAQIGIEGRLPVVVANKAGLTQCLSNLLGNAVKFVRPGQRPQIRVWAEEREGWARIWVEDKGIGISKEMLPKVFDMFSRGSEGYEGTGIGLALVRKVAQRMGGWVGVESEEGSGSRFWIELRLGAMRAQPERVEAAPAGARGGTVLYVEDEESDAMFMKVAFEEKGMESALRVVSNGRAAIEYLSGAGKYADRRGYPLPSVVLLDLNLPQVTGFEVLKWMRNRPEFAATPVVVFSSSALEDDQVKALELGANEFVAKPSSGLKFGEVVEGLRERWMGAAVSG